MPRSIMPVWPLVVAVASLTPSESRGRGELVFAFGSPEALRVVRRRLTGWGSC